MFQTSSILKLSS